MKELLEMQLPKWPAIKIIGKPISIEQAKDIIFRCDPFLTDIFGYIGGNDHEFAEEYFRKSGLERLKDRSEDVYDVFYEHFGIISNRLQYLEIDLGSSSYIYGPTGWCNINGEIYLENKNIGKWPTVLEIYDDWKIIAEAFPYLDLICTVFDDEYCEDDKKPLVSFIIKDGMVELSEPLKSYRTVPANIPSEPLIDRYGCLGRELGLPEKWYDEFASKILKYVDSIGL